jgi:hypothetical protein
MNLPLPNSQKKRILLGLIQSNKGISEQDFGWHSFRHHISVLRNDLLIKFTEVPFKSVYGNKNSYRRHWLTNSEKKKAIKLYLSLVKKAA